MIIGFCFFFRSGQRCSILQGNVSLIDEASRPALSTGQIYTITVDLEVPESEINFEVKIDFDNINQKKVSTWRNTL